MLRREYFELHKELKKRIKGKIFVGVRDGMVSVNIKGFRNITFKKTIKDATNVMDVADLIERKYRKFILKKFFLWRDKNEAGRKR